MNYYKNDSTNNVAEFSDYQSSPPPGWSSLTQEEEDAYLLKKAKIAKLRTLKTDLEAFCGAGCVYLTWTFDLTEASIQNILAKNGDTTSPADRYEFYDMGNVDTDTPPVQRDFVDNAGFTAFKDAMWTERNRIMVKYNDYKNQIISAVSIAAVDAITISFAV